MIWRVDLAFKYKVIYPLMHGRFYRPTTYIESSIKRFFYLHLATLIIVFITFCARPQKGLEMCPFYFQNFKIKIFLSIFQKYLQKCIARTLFTLFWYPTLNLWFFFFTLFVCGSQGVPIIFNSWKIKILSTRKIF